MFEITKLSERRLYSLSVPVAACPRGFAFQESATPGVAALSFGTGPIVGFVTREVLDITSDAGKLRQYKNATMPNQGQVFEAGGNSSNLASFEYAEEFTAENQGAYGGDDHIYVTGAGALSTATPINTPVSFSGGKACKAISGQVAEYAVANPNDSTNSESGGLRQIYRRLPAPIIA